MIKNKIKSNKKLLNVNKYLSILENQLPERNPCAILQKVWAKDSR